MFMYMHMPSVFPAAESCIVCPDEASPGSTRMCTYKIDESETAHVSVFIEHLDTGGNCSLYVNIMERVRHCNHIGLDITINNSYVTAI